MRFPQAVHGLWMKSVKKYFNKKCSIQANSPSGAALINPPPDLDNDPYGEGASDPYAEQSETWSSYQDSTGLIYDDIVCVKGLVKTYQSGSGDKVFFQTDNVICLWGYYPNVTEAMRVVLSNGETWKINSVISDGREILTQLTVERVIKPEGSQVEPEPEPEIVFPTLDGVVDLGGLGF